MHEPSPGQLRRALNQPVFVKDQGGRQFDARPGTNFVVHALPDGYTLLMGFGHADGHRNSVCAQTLSAAAGPPSWSPLLVQTDLVLVVNFPVKARTISRSFRALAHNKPAILNYGSPGLGTLPHMAAELLKQITRIDIVHRRRTTTTGMMRINLLRGDTQILDRHCAVAAAGHSVRLGPRDRYQRRATRRRSCPTCRPLPKPVWTFRRRNGSDSWRRKGHRSRPSTRSTRPSSTSSINQTLKSGLGEAGRNTHGYDPEPSSPPSFSVRSTNGPR